MAKPVTTPRPLTRRELLAVARRKGLSIRSHGSRTIITLPDKSHVSVSFTQAHLDDQTRAFRRAGLVP